MHSAVCAVAPCLSVCPSVTLVHCVKTTELIIKQLAFCIVAEGLWFTDTKHRIYIF